MQSPFHIPRHALRRLWNGGFISQATIDDLHRRQLQGDPFGVRLHLFFACLACLLIAGPVTAVEFAGLAIGFAFGARLLFHWRDRYIAMFLIPLMQPLIFTLLLWMAWQFLALAWSGNVRLGLNEISSLRWTWMWLFFYPILHRRRTLIIALACGYLIANAVQSLHFIGTLTDNDSLTFGRMPDRISGWWKPVVGGTMLVGALGLHLPAAFLGRGRTQVFACIGAAITLLGIIATGSRGPWLAAGALIAIVAGVAVWSIRPHARRLRVLLIGAVVAIIVAGAAWAAIGDSITRRINLAGQEITTAVRDKQFDSDTGARLLMWWWALEAMGQRPIQGVGAGGYPSWVQTHLEDKDIDPARRRIHDHAHSTPLHVGATTGVIGLALGTLIIIVALRGSLVGIDRTRLGNYDAGPFFAIIGLLIAGLFDPVHVNAQTAALLTTLIALCQYARPETTP